jgi:hypothetical protein
MSSKNEKLIKLVKRNESLKAIIFKEFESEEEHNNYRKSITNEREEYFNNMEEIEQLELELMTPEERKRHEKQMRFLALKAKGEPFDLDEFDDM